jgi:RNA polymerase sigma-70 factor (ECF subfamily)
LVSESALDAFDETYDREFEYVWRTLGRFGVSEHELPDATHDVFLVLHRRWNEIDRSRPMRPWLFGVARRVAADARAKQRERPSEAETVAPSDPLEQQRNLVWRSLAELDDAKRSIIILHDLEGYTGAEIAEQLDIPINTVHSRLRLARADLLAEVNKRRGGR